MKSFLMDLDIRGQKGGVVFNHLPMGAFHKTPDKNKGADTKSDGGDRNARTSFTTCDVTPRYLQEGHHYGIFCKFVRVKRSSSRGALYSTSINFMMVECPSLIREVMAQTLGMTRSDTCPMSE